MVIIKFLFKVSSVAMYFKVQKKIILDKINKFRNYFTTVKLLNRILYKNYDSSTNECKQFSFNFLMFFRRAESLLIIQNLKLIWKILENKINIKRTFTLLFLREVFKFRFFELEYI